MFSYALYTPLLLASALMTAGFVNTANADDIETSLTLGAETRVFFQDPLFDSQVENAQLSFSISPEVKWQTEDRGQRASFIGFTRFDSEDDERTHSDIRELFYARSWDSLTLTAGINKVFWGVTESVHLVDIINQTDLVEDIDQEDKLGQPMIQLSSQKDWGRVEAFVLPYFRKRTFTSEDGRFYLGLPVDDDAAFQSDDDEQHLDWALRYSHFIGDIDIGMHLFDGTNREPQLRLMSNGSLRPFYEQIQQFGLDAQYTYDAWLLKLETIYRASDFDEFAAAVAGLEYTLFQVADSTMDLGLLLEYQYDDRDQNVTFSFADNDFFLAARLGLNDIQDTSVLAGVVIDADTSSQFFNVEAERRLGNRFVAELRARFLTNADQGDADFIFSQDDYVQVTLNYYL